MVSFNSIKMLMLYLIDSLKNKWPFKCIRYFRKYIVRQELFNVLNGRRRSTKILSLNTNSETQYRSSHWFDKLHDLQIIILLYRETSYLVSRKGSESWEVRNKSTMLSAKRAFILNIFIVYITSGLFPSIW